MNNEVKKYVREICRTRPGWVYGGYTGSGHVRLNYKPGGFVVLSATPSSPRWGDNTERDLASVERQYGPYSPEPLQKEGRKERGYSYRELANQHIIMPATQNTPPIIADNFFSYRPPEPKTQPVLPEILPAPPSTKEKIMTTPLLDREILIRVLQEKYDALKPKLEPLLEEFEEYKRVEKALNDLKRIAVSDAEKVEQFMKEKAAKRGNGITPPAQIALPVEGEEKPRAKSKEVYAAIEEIVQSHGGKMPISEIMDWLESVKGYNYQLMGLTPRTSVAQHVRLINSGRPATRQTLKLGPEKTESQKRASYEYIEYRDNNTEIALQHY